MDRVVEFTLDDGGSVWVVSDLSGPGEVTRGGGGRVVERAQESFESAVARIRPAAQAILHQVSDLATTPETVVVEFGVQLSAAAGAVITSAQAQGNFRLTLTWKPNASAHPGP